MFRRLSGTTLLAAAAVVGLSAGSVFADSATNNSLVLGNSGWTAVWPKDAYLPQGSTLSLTVENQDANTVYLKKTATFGSIDNLPITFVQTSANALPQIAIESESVTNSTGQDWNGFKWMILGSSTHTSADAQFNVTASNVGQSDGFTIDPFTNAAFTDNSGTGSVDLPYVLTVSGGTVADGAIYAPGSRVDDGSLFIHAAPNGTGDYSFTLKEIPTGGSTPVIPLPAAFWSGLSGLLGLGCLGLIRRRKLA